MPETVLVQIVGDAKQYIAEMNKSEQATQKFTETTAKGGTKAATSFNSFSNKLGSTDLNMRKLGTSARGVLSSLGPMGGMVGDLVGGFVQMGTTMGGMGVAFAGFSFAIKELIGHLTKLAEIQQTVVNTQFQVGKTAPDILSGYISAMNQSFNALGALASQGGAGGGKAKKILLQLQQEYHDLGYFQRNTAKQLYELVAYWTPLPGTPLAAAVKEVGYFYEYVKGLPEVMTNAANIALSGEGVSLVDKLKQATETKETKEEKPQEVKPYIETENVFLELEAGLRTMGKTLPDLVKLFEDAGDKIDEAIKQWEESLKSFAGSFNEIFEAGLSPALEGLWEDTFGKLKVELNDTMGVGEKFFARMLNSIIDMMGQLAVQAIAWGALIMTLNAIAPGAGTAFAAMMGGIGGAGGILGAVGSIGGAIKGVRGFDDPFNDMWLKRQGYDMAKYFSRGMNEARPLSAPATALNTQRPVIVLNGGLENFVSSVRGAEPMTRRKLARLISYDVSKEERRSIG